MFLILFSSFILQLSAYKDLHGVGVSQFNRQENAPICSLIKMSIEDGTISSCTSSIFFKDNELYMVTAEHCKPLNNELSFLNCGFKVDDEANLAVDLKRGVVSVEMSATTDNGIIIPLSTGYIKESSFKDVLFTKINLKELERQLPELTDLIEEYKKLLDFEINIPSKKLLEENEIDSTSQCFIAGYNIKVKHDVFTFNLRKASFQDGYAILLERSHDKIFENLLDEGESLLFILNKEEIENTGDFIPIVFSDHGDSGAPIICEIESKMYLLGVASAIITNDDDDNLLLRGGTIIYQANSFLETIENMMN